MISTNADSSNCMHLKQRQTPCRSLISQEDSFINLIQTGVQLSSRTSFQSSCFPLLIVALSAHSFIFLHFNHIRRRGAEVAGCLTLHGRCKSQQKLIIDMLEPNEGGGDYGFRASDEYRLYDPTKLVEHSRLSRQSLRAHGDEYDEIDKKEREKYDSGRQDVEKSHSFIDGFAAELNDSNNESNQQHEPMGRESRQSSHKEIEDIMKGSKHGYQNTNNEKDNEDGSIKKADVLGTSQSKESQLTIKKKTSNPKFIEMEKTQTTQLLSNLQQLTKDRHKHGQVHYFSKKQRFLEEKDIQEIFASYASNRTSSPPAPPPQQQPIKNHSKLSPHAHQDKQCQLCHISKFKEVLNSTPKAPKQNRLLIWDTGLQPQIKRTNASPSRSIHSRYLSSAEKDQGERIVWEANDEYLEAGKLKQEYLRSAKEQKRLDIERELQVLKNWKGNSKKKERHTSSRKKIFATNSVLTSPSHIRIEDPAFPKTPLRNPPRTSSHISTSKEKPLFRNIFSSKSKEKQSATASPSRPLDFHYVRQSLITSRIKIFNSNSPPKQPSPRKASPSHSPQTAKTRRDLMQSLRRNTRGQTRTWLQQRETAIIDQVEKISSYELIGRYLSPSEVEMRLIRLVGGMVEPKRWVLLLVDEVYARLKDRYLS